MDDTFPSPTSLAERLHTQPIPIDDDLHTLRMVFDQVRRALADTLAASPRVDCEHFLVLMDGVLLGGDELLRALHSFIRNAGGFCTDILPATDLWEDKYLGWQACFKFFGAEPPAELSDCRDCFWKLLDSMDPKPPLFVFIEHLEKFAIQDSRIQDQARRSFLAPLMRDFYTFPVFLISQVRHFPGQPLDYLKGFPLSSTTKRFPLERWTPDEIIAHHAQVAGLNESLRSEVLRLTSGSPGIAARLADKLQTDSDLRNACRAVLTDLMHGYNDVTEQWPDYQRLLSEIIIDRANQIDIFNLPPGGMFGPGPDPLRRLMRLCVIELHGTSYRVATPFEQLLRGTL